MLEKDLERLIGEYVKKRGGLFLKFSSPNNRGVPDRICLFPGGRMMFLEVKAPGKKPTALQLKTLERYRDLGHRAEWADSVERATRYIDATFLV